MNDFAYAAIPIFAFLMDAVLGDPRSSWHPVVLIGNAITFWEKRLYQKEGQRKQFWSGVLLVLATVVTVLLVTWSVLWLSSLAGYYVYIFIAVVVVYFTITPKALSRDANELIFLLQTGNLTRARQRLSWIVGRDTENLDESEISRATIETVAENITDGIISPLFYFMLFGPLGAMFYRTCNTMDSMVGYKNEKYLYFGRFAARWDDVLNYIPARITMLLLLISSYILRYNTKGAWQIAKRDAKLHPSPNGGYAEATVAGALNIRLGGFNYYGGKEEFRAYMGEPIETISRIHIRKTVKLMYVSTIIAVVLITVLLYIL